MQDFCTVVSSSRNELKDGTALLVKHQIFRLLFSYGHFNLRLTIRQESYREWEKFSRAVCLDWKVICLRFESPRIPPEPVESNWMTGCPLQPTFAALLLLQHSKNLNSSYTLSFLQIKYWLKMGFLSWAQIIFKFSVVALQNTIALRCSSFSLGKFSSVSMKKICFCRI